MPTWKLDVEYDGTRYRGWQMQHLSKSIQGELLDVTRQLFSAKVDLFGAEWTDAGVHALGQVVHLKVPELKVNLTPTQIRQGFNELLPPDINILKASNASEDFHARNDAVSRYYIYQIATRRTAFGKNFVWWIKDKIDPKAMNEASKILVGKHDFRSFSEPIEGKKQSPIVVIEKAEVFTDGEMICFRIGASHFLWKMVRRIAGMLVEVGRGNLTYDGFERLLRFKSDVPAKFIAPPSGLFLEKVLYKDDRPPTEHVATFRLS
jgi:tRNA pseudouridine38-40 synthase